MVVSLRHRLSHRSSSNQTVNMGQSRRCSRKTNGDQQSEQRHRQRARLLSVTSSHSSDWLHTLPLSGCACDSTTASSTSLLGFDWEQTYASLTSALAERLLTQEGCMVRVQRGQRSLHRASQPERPGVASDAEGGHPSVEGAVRPA